jgi:hypothetical protein
VDLARVKVEVDAVIRKHAGKPLRDAAQLEDGCRVFHGVAVGSGRSTRSLTGQAD